MADKPKKPGKRPAADDPGKLHEWLCDAVRWHNYLYYEQAEPEVTDAEYDRLMDDDILRDWHRKGLEWHRAKAVDLHGQPEFEELYQQALEVKLTGTERVAYALALDMES